MLSFTLASEAVWYPAALHQSLLGISITVLDDDIIATSMESS